MLKKLTLLFIILSGSALSQPVVNSSNFPVKGTVLKYFTGNSETAVNYNSGADQTWDFSFMPLSFIDDVEYGNVTDSKFRSNFPASTIAFEAPAGSGDFTFLDISETHMKYLGFIANSCEVPVICKYDNDWLVYYFPLQFNDVLHDDFSSSSTVIFGGDTVETYFEGYYAYKVDGYGTVITPYKTFPNSLRINSMTIGRDSAIHRGTVDNTIVTDYSSVKVSWISSEAGNFFEQVSTPDFKNFYFEDVVTADNVSGNESKKNRLILFPDPATTFINIELPEMNARQATIYIHNNLGNVVKTFHVNISTGNYFKTQIPVSDLSPGIYDVRISSGEDEWEAKFVKQ